MKTEFSDSYEEMDKFFDELFKFICRYCLTTEVNYRSICNSISKQDMVALFEKHMGIEEK